MVRTEECSEILSAASICLTLHELLQAPLPLEHPPPISGGIRRLNFLTYFLQRGGGAHIFLCPFHPAFWHAAPQEACLQREQILSVPPRLPQWEQVSLSLEGG